MSHHEMKDITVEEVRPQGFVVDERSMAQQKDDNDARVLETLGDRQQLNVSISIPDCWIEPALAF